jgi:hypothetical protein
MDRVNIRLQRRLRGPVPDVVNLFHWFDKRSVTTLREILAAIQPERNKSVRDFLLVSFSALMRKVSLTDPRLTVPVKIKNQKETPKSRRAILNLFRKGVASNVDRMSEFRRLHRTSATASSFLSDARLAVCSGNVKKHSAQLIVTSPPYGGAQKYVRASSLSLGWLGFVKTSGLRSLEDSTIGREHFRRTQRPKVDQTSVQAANRVIQQIRKTNALRACISATYINEMEAAFVEIESALRPGGFLVLIIGNNRVCGRPFLTHRYLTTILSRIGLKLVLRLVDDIKSRGLMTKRNKTASVIWREWVLVFKKGELG